MSLGSRLMNRGRTAIIASLPRTPREPLLFLYPQWARNSSSSSAPAYNQNGTSPSNLQHTPVRPYIIDPLQDNATGPLKGDTEQDAEHGKEILSGGVGSSRLEHNPKVLPIGNAQHRKQKGHFDTQLRSQVPKIRAIYSNVLNDQVKAEHNRGVRMAYQAYVRQKKGSWEPDWRVILSDLLQNTPNHQRWLDKALILELPDSAVGTLVHGIDDTMWEIAKRHESSVELHTPGSENGHVKFVISGSATAISKTAAHILQIAPQVKLNVATQEGSSLGLKMQKVNTTFDIDKEGVQGERDGNARYTISTAHRAIPITSADSIYRPQEWTQQTFADYVEDLTSLEVPNHLHRLMYPGRQDHIGRVIEILRKIFLDPECRSSLTRHAFNMATQYFVKTNRILDARIFFVHMEMMKIPMNVETFNILLRGAAKNEDLHNFHFILHLMLKRNISPNAKTWIAFLRTLPDLRLKLYAFKKMKEKGLLRNKVNIKGACEQIVSHEIATSLDQGQSQAEFLRHMDSRYGPSWLQTGIANRIIHGLAGRGLISRCWEFLFVMNDRYVKVDQITINTTLNHCKIQGNTPGAIEFLRSLPPFVHSRPDEMTYHVLFEMAWRKKNYNLAKVVWRYACLDVGTTFRMRRRITASLRNYPLFFTPRQKKRQLFEASVGYFITSGKSLTNHPGVIIQKDFKDIFGFDMFQGTTEIQQQQRTPKHALSGEPEPQDGFLPGSETSQRFLQPKDSEPSHNLETLSTEADNISNLVNPEIQDSIDFKGSEMPPSAVKDVAPPEIMDAQLSQDHGRSTSESVSVIPSSELGESLYSQYKETLPSKPKVAASGIKRESFQKIWQFLEYDQQIFQWWKPVVPFADKLVEAWTMDQEWKATTKGSDSRSDNREEFLAWRINNSISIPIRADIGQNKPLEMEWK